MLSWMDSLKGRSMMRLASFTDEEMVNLIDLSAQLKARRAAGVRGDLLHKKINNKCKKNVEWLQY